MLSLWNHEDGAGDGAEIDTLDRSALQLGVVTFNLKVLAFIKITRLNC